MKQTDSLIAGPLVPMASLGLKDSKIKPFTLSTIGTASSNRGKTTFLFEMEFIEKEVGKPSDVGIILPVFACGNLEDYLMPATRFFRLVDLVVLRIQPIAGIPESSSWSEKMHQAVEKVLANVVLFVVRVNIQL